MCSVGPINEAVSDLWKSTKDKRKIGIRDDFWASEAGFNSDHELKSGGLRPSSRPRPSSKVAILQKKYFRIDL